MIKIGAKSQSGKYLGMEGMHSNTCSNHHWYYKTNQLKVLQHILIHHYLFF
jgi:hypothetical protein